MRMLILGLVLGLLGACASNPKNDEAPLETEQAKEENPDSFEGFNRAIFSFNDTLDRWILKPVAESYDWAMPARVKLSVGNFFSNLGEIKNVINDGLQWKWKQAANDSGRFLLNTTFGVVGLFDVASKVGLEKSEGESFSQTLAVWGVPRGPYLVLPIFGSSTLRGGITMPVDWASSPMQYVDDTNTQIALNTLDTVHSRALLLETEELITGDRYVFVREVYLQRLEYLENDGKIEDDFGGEFEDDEYADYDF
ncbi:MAG: VacJ family lipoprotein [Agarilytica sp.]